MRKLFIALAILLCMSACQWGGQKTAIDEALPTAPDYNDTTQWYVTDRHAEADLFYIISTETGDYVLPDGTVRHHADTYADSLRQPLYGEMLGVDTLVSGKLNYYSPYYRQCSMQTFANDSTSEARMPIALDDVRRAFAYYLEHLNGGRPFILAGFSQGARILLTLLEEMDDNTYRRMIAAYAIGTTIPQELVDRCPRVVAARGADDTGVTICYNSVRDLDGAFSTNSAFAINPVNWKTDATPAVFVTEPTAMLPVSEQEKITMTVHLDTASKLLFVEGYKGPSQVLPVIGKEGNYHTSEIWFYRHHLRDNMALRAARFLAKEKSNP